MLKNNNAGSCQLILKEHQNQSMQMIKDLSDPFIRCNYNVTHSLCIVWTTDAGCGKEKIKSNSCRMRCRDYILVDLYHKSGDSDVWNVHDILMPDADSLPSIQLHEKKRTLL